MHLLDTAPVKWPPAVIRMINILLAMRLIKEPSISEDSNPFIPAGLRLVTITWLAPIHCIMVAILMASAGKLQKGGACYQYTLWAITDFAAKVIFPNIGHG